MAGTTHSDNVLLHHLVQLRVDSNDLCSVSADWVADSPGRGRDHNNDATTSGVSSIRPVELTATIMHVQREHRSADVVQRHRHGTDGMGWVMLGTSALDLRALVIGSTSVT